MKKLTVRDLVLCALMAALLAVCAWISFPVLEIAYTLQTFGVFFALLVLGGARGTLAIFVYILLGAVGLPVFTGFRGGIGSCWASPVATSWASCLRAWCTGS